MVLTHRGVSLLVSNPPRDVLDAFNPLRNVLRVFVSFTQLRVFLSFLDAFLNFLLHFLPFRNLLRIFEIFFNKLPIV